MADVVKDARDLKSKAMEARDARRFGQAISLIEQAERGLRDALGELRENREPAEKPGKLETEVVNQLIHILGSKGGIHRRNKNYVDSARAYDAGYEFEVAGPVYGIINSYNLVQRLVSRVFLSPESAEDESMEVLGLSVRRELQKAKKEIQQQHKGPRDKAPRTKGPRAEDEYAAADLAMVSLLLGDADWESDLDDFINFAPPPEPYALQVTSKLITELREALEGSPTAPAALKRRLSEASEEFTYS